MSSRVQLTGMTEKEFAAYVLYSNEKNNGLWNGC